MGKKQNKKRRNILLGTLIPLGAVATAAAIAVPVVLAKEKTKIVMCSTRAQKAKIVSTKINNDKTISIQLECTSSKAEDKILSLDITRGGVELQIGEDFTFDFNTYEIVILEKGLKKATGKTIIDAGVGTTFSSLGAAWSNFMSNYKRPASQPIGVKATTYIPNDQEVSVKGSAYGILDADGVYLSGSGFFEREIINGATTEYRAMCLHTNYADFSGEMEASIPASTYAKVFGHTDKDDIFMLVMTSDHNIPWGMLAMSYNGFVRKSIGSWGRFNEINNKKPNIEIDKFIWNEWELPIINVNDNDSSIKPTIYSTVVSKDAAEYEFKINPSTAASGHFELTFTANDGEVIKLGSSDESQYAASTEATVKMKIDTNKYSLLLTHQDIMLKFVAA